MMATSASIRSVRLLLIFFFTLASLYYISRSYSRIPLPPTSDSFTPGGKQPAKPASQFPLPGDGQPVPSNGQSLQPGENQQTGKTKAAFVTLIRNHEIWDIARSIRQVEDRFNRNYHYPWVFLNDVPFTDEFIQVTSALTSGKAKYGISPPHNCTLHLSLCLSSNFLHVRDSRMRLIVALVPKEHWSIPPWIDEEKAKKAREDMEHRNIIYGGSLPYRHMCRFQSGFFWRQAILDEYDWYWRVEPGTNYYCDIDYDVFEFMELNNYKYGFTMSLHEYVDTVPTLWEETKVSLELEVVFNGQKFLKQNPKYLANGNALDFISCTSTSTQPNCSDNKGDTYNMCHFVYLLLGFWSDGSGRTLKLRH